MNPLAHFNEAMSYIEKNLMNDIDLTQISILSGCSKYHFRRMFSFLAGMPLGEYIRRRRLSQAGILLQTEKIKVIDLALQFGYETPEAFSKAFQSMHGVTPSQAKNKNVELKILPPLTFQLTLRGGIEMNYRIVEKEAFYIIGFKKRISLQFKGVNPHMEELTKHLTPDVITTLKSLSDTQPSGIISVSANFSERTVENSELDQYIGVATTQEINSSFDILPVEASTWVVFKVIGKFPDAVQETWSRIYGEWFPSSGYELIEGPELLWNEGLDMNKSDYKSEIWIPVLKK